MINLNKIILVAVPFFCCNWAGAGEAIIFNDPGLTGYREGGAISGMYSAESGRFSCIFLFVQKSLPPGELDKDGFLDTKILTFVPDDKSFFFVDRDKTFDIGGDLYQKGGDWIIKTSTAQAGCENTAGTFIFERDSPSATTYSIDREIPAIGIRLIKKKSYFYDYGDGKYVTRKGYLTKWDGVVLLKTQDDFSYVRFVDPRTDAKTSGKVTTGWVHSSDLVNPFPPLSR